MTNPVPHQKYYSMKVHQHRTYKIPISVITADCIDLAVNICSNFHHALSDGAAPVNWQDISIS